MKPYYDDGQVTLYHGDCREILPTIPLSGNDLLLTDPPYGIRYSPSQNSKKAWGNKTFVGNTVVQGDDKPFDPGDLLAHPRLILFGANHYADKLPPRDSWIVWDKRVDMASNDFADCEFAWVSTGGPARIYRHLWNGALRASERGEPRVHPTQKPVALMRWIIEMHTKPGERVVDPFSGSGSTLVAAKSCGRRAIGIEINEAYCKATVARLAQGSLFGASA